MSELKAFIVRYNGKFIRAYEETEVDKVIIHNKYKRCLAMSNWCMTEYIHSKCLDFTNTEQWYWRRWHIRWRNLAKKFKPNYEESK